MTFSLLSAGLASGLRRCAFLFEQVALALFLITRLAFLGLFFGGSVPPLGKASFTPLVLGLTKPLVSPVGTITSGIEVGSTQVLSRLLNLADEIEISQPLFSISCLLLLLQPLLSRLVSRRLLLLAQLYDLVLAIFTYGAAWPAEAAFFLHYKSGDGQLTELGCRVKASMPIAIDGIWVCISL